MSVNEDMLKLKLKNIQTKLEDCTSILDSYHKERKSVIKFCYDNGMSVISIANELNMTRQRVYKILDAIEEEEVQLA
jgi:predicted DNA-binding protein YlxM (UPF0122 family)